MSNNNMIAQHYKSKQNYQQGDYMEEECGIFGVYAPDQDVSMLTYYGLYALQHRGQESAGIAVSDSYNVHTEKGMGLVSEVFDDEQLSQMTGKIAVGHVRYSTSGASTVINAQPLTVNCRLGQLSFAHNGNLTNGDKLHHELENQGTIFHTTSDSEILAHLLAKSDKKDLVTAIKQIHNRIAGAYNYLIMNNERLIGIRDPHGYRPLSLGQIGDGYVLASETCALDTIGAEFIRDIQPGEMVVIDNNGVTSNQLVSNTDPSLCVFEYIYFARPDSNLNNRNVHLVRKELGKQLARELSPELTNSADVVSGVPDSSLSAASGVSEELGIPYEMALIKNRYVGRTFIKPSQKLREISVNIKLNPVDQTVSGKSILLVDDSIVRGTTISNLIKSLKSAGAKEVHVLISSPPVIQPCSYGIDTSSTGELIATDRSIEEITELIQADSLHFLTTDGMMSAVDNIAPKQQEEGFCTSCFTAKQLISKL